jgi:hypothetical protein
MKKEVKDSVNPTPVTNTASGEKKKKVVFRTKLVSKGDDNEKSAFPRELKPTKKTNYIFIAILVVVLLWGFIQFPWGSVFSLEQEVQIKLGYPMAFFYLDLMNPEGFPFKFGGLIVDLLIYVIIAYIIDVVLNVAFMKPPVSKKKEPKKNVVINVQNNVVEKEVVKKKVVEREDVNNLK